MSHVLQSETGMPVQRLLKLAKIDNDIKVLIRWKGLPQSEDSWEPILNVHEDVPQLLEKLLQRKNVPAELVEKAKSVLGL